MRYVTTKDIREILAAHKIDSVSIEYKNDTYAEEFKVEKNAYAFTLSHKGTPISMANALSSFIGSLGECEESVLTHMTGASRDIRTVITKKESSIIDKWKNWKTSENC